MKGFFPCSFLGCFMAHQSWVKEHLWVPAACGVLWGTSGGEAAGMELG